MNLDPKQKCAMCVVLLTTCWEITINTAEKCAPPNTANIQVITFPLTVTGAYVPILDLAGKDATDIFDSVHTRGMLDDFDVIGELKK